MSAFITFIQNHGGIVAVFLVVLAIYNIVMSAIAQIFAKLQKQEPAFLQTMGSVGLKLSQWLSANTPTPSSAGAQTNPPSGS